MEPSDLIEVRYRNAEAFESRHVTWVSIFHLGHVLETFREYRIFDGVEDPPVEYRGQFTVPDNHPTDFGPIYFEVIGFS